jgi:hypothetical protein
MASPWVGADVEADPLERARVLRRAHQSVLSGGERPAGLRELVLSSWLRCREAGVDPDRPALRLLSAPQAASRLAAHPLARQLPLMRSLMAGVADDARHIMVLSDADGLLLWAEGHPKMLSAAAATNFLPGGLCSETAVGTNAVGTTLVLDHPLQIFSAEHYSSLFHGWACSAAPLHDPATGEILGAIDLSGDYRTAHPHSLSLVTAVARAAEVQLALETARRDEQLRTRYVSLISRNGRQPSALVTTAGRILMANPPGWLGEPAPVPARGGRFALPNGGEAVAEPLESGHGYLVWRVSAGAVAPPGATLRLEALGRRRAWLRQAGGAVELSRRHSEILVLLALNPGGASGEDLALQIYGSRDKSASLRAEMSRLRRVLGCLLLASPYRLKAEVQADFLDVRRLLDRGRFAEAARRYAGPLLPVSQVPAVVATREDLEVRLRASAALG